LVRPPLAFASVAARRRPEPVERPQRQLSVFMKEQDANAAPAKGTE